MLIGQARVGGGWDFIVKAGADGSVMWRGQTIESDTWNRIKEYDRQHGVTETWSQVADASKRYSTQTGDSEMASRDESLSANLTRMRTFQERASLSRQESESWSEQAAQVRSDAQAIGRDLGQPFFDWLSERKGTDGRALGAAGAMRIALPQTAEDSEQLREYAAAFIAEKYPAPAGPDPATVGGAAEPDHAERTGADRPGIGRSASRRPGAGAARELRLLQDRRCGADERAVGMELGDPEDDFHRQIVERPDGGHIGKPGRLGTAGSGGRGNPTTRPRARVATIGAVARNARCEPLPISGIPRDARPLAETGPPERPPHRCFDVPNCGGRPPLRDPERSKPSCGVVPDPDRRASGSRQRNTVHGVMRCRGRLYVIGERQRDQSHNQRNDQKNHEGDFQVVPQHSFSRGHTAGAPNARVCG